MSEDVFLEFASKGEKGVDASNMRLYPITQTLIKNQMTGDSISCSQLTLEDKILDLIRTRRHKELLETMYKQQIL